MKPYEEALNAAMGEALQLGTPLTPPTDPLIEDLCLYLEARAFQEMNGLLEAPVGRKKLFKLYIAAKALYDEAAALRARGTLDVK